MRSVMKAMNVARRYGAKLVVATGLMSMSAMALASTGPTMDVTEVTDFIGTTATAAVGSIAVASLILHYSVKAYKWARSAG